jgi:hypothetical protein
VTLKRWRALTALDERRRRMEFRISRRELLRSTAGNAVVKAVGIGGLLELLANREAIAAGNVIAIHGVTRERTPTTETPHRHTFAAQFVVTSVTSSSIIGDLYGRTAAVISTGGVREDQHAHLLQSTQVSLEQLIFTGPEIGEEDGHTHLVALG